MFPKISLSSKALLRVAYIAALPACAAFAFVACSSGHFAPTPAAVGANSADRVAPSIIPDFSLRGEVLTASSVTVKYAGHCGNCRLTNFNASGAAKGPFPGTFVASGSWRSCTMLHGGYYWHFDESLKIRSGGSSASRFIVGNGGCSDYSCTGILTQTTFGPTSTTVKLSLRKSGTWIGSVQTNVIQASSLTEWLH